MIAKKKPKCEGVSKKKLFTRTFKCINLEIYMSISGEPYPA